MQQTQQQKNEFFTEDFRKIFLKLIIDSPEYFDMYVDYIPESVFGDSILKYIYRAIIKIRRDKNHILPISKGELEVVVVDLIKNESLLDAVYNVLNEIYKETYNEDTVTELVEDWIKKERIIQAIYKSIDYIKDKKFEDIVDIIEDAVTVKFNSKNYSTFLDLFNSSSEAEEEKKQRLSTGFKTLDECLMGGLGSGEVHILLGGAKGGKTTMAIQMAVNALKTGNTVVHISLELKEKLIHWKYTCCITGLTYDEVRDSSNLELVKKRLNMFKNIYKPNLVIKKFQAGKVNCNHIKGFINSLIYNKVIEKPDLIIIDYDALLMPTKRHKDKYDNEGQKHLDLISLAEYFNCPVLVPAQTNREGWKKSERGEIITSADLAESAAKKMHCDSIVTLNVIDPNRMILYVDTVRFGISGREIMTLIDFSRNRIAEDIGGKPYKMMADVDEMELDLNNEFIVKEIKEEKEDINNENIEGGMKEYEEFEF